MTFIFIGRSGSGKGTQAKLLIKYLAGAPVIYLETGRYVRELINQQTYSGRLAKVVSERGERQPDFIAVYLWSNFLINNLIGGPSADSPRFGEAGEAGEHLVFDGTPRSLVEAQALDTAVAFYKLEKPRVIFLDISVARARERLANRGREDDDKDGIEKRLGWYERDVEPVIDYYRRHSGYQFLRIDGDQEVEMIHGEIKRLCFEIENTGGN
ncbi:MAG: nucleoside monophosphate kinase [Candidatus Vogelbacteria bacterium]|nr:nucleoside monophosphate kinase [Candidatus Vogelbacteria bacterium]